MGQVAGGRRNDQRAERVEGASDRKSKRQSEQGKGTTGGRRGEGTSGGQDERQVGGGTSSGWSGVRGHATDGAGQGDK